MSSLSFDYSDHVDAKIKFLSISSKCRQVHSHHQYSTLYHHCHQSSTVCKLWSIVVHTYTKLPQCTMLPYMFSSRHCMCISPNSPSLSLSLPLSQIEESAKKAVEGANTASAAVKLYNKWHKLIAPEAATENGEAAQGGGVDGEVKEKKGILSRVKSHIKGKGKNESVRTTKTV